MTPTNRFLLSSVFGMALMLLAVALESAKAATFPANLTRVCLIGHTEEGSFECYDAFFGIEFIEFCGDTRPITAYEAGRGTVTLFFAQGVGDPITVAYENRSYQRNYFGQGLDVLNVVVTPEFSDSAEACLLYHH